MAIKTPNSKASLAALLVALAAAEPNAAQAQVNKRVFKPVDTAPASKVLIPQPATPSEARNNNAMITKDGRSITLGEIRAQQQLFKPPAAPAVVKQSLLGAKAAKMSTIAPVGPPSQGSGAGTALNGRASDPSNIALKVPNCDVDPPRIGRVVGNATPGSVISVRGSCFGGTSGEVRLHGNFPGGFRSLPAIKWEDGQIAVQIPADLSGVTDGQMSIDAITPQRKATNTLSVQFTARREIVDVTHLWRSSCRNFQRENNRYTFDIKCGNNWVDYHEIEDTGAQLIVEDDIVFGKPQYGSYTIQINQNCALNNAWADVRRGSVTEIRGWYDGPPHISKVGISGREEEYLDVHWYGDDLHKYWNFSLRANAECPVGISPNP
jgi:hypothetical protein